MFLTTAGHFIEDPFETEAQLEAAVAEVAGVLFGPNRYYFDIKKSIGAKNKTKNIPDGYLLDLSSRKDPKLFVVENELASHDPLKHVAVQILEFSLSFTSSPFKLKEHLKAALKSKPEALQACEAYASANGFDNVDFLLERMIRKDDAFNALVIIDDLDDELETLLLSRFKFSVEVLTFRRFLAKDGQRAYEFKPFLADLNNAVGVTDPNSLVPPPNTEPSDVDTIVVSAQEDGFTETFIGENRWYKIRIHASMIPHIKYIAVYRVAPVSAITHVARVKKIELWPGTTKYSLEFEEPATEIKHVKLIPKPTGRVKAPQGPRYTSYIRLMKATNLDDVF
jgi:hypothetical protein